jgi:hypothetical protein
MLMVNPAHAFYEIAGRKAAGLPQIIKEDPAPAPAPEPGQKGYHQQPKAGWNGFH